MFSTLVRRQPLLLGMVPLFLFNGFVSTSLSMPIFLTKYEIVTVGIFFALLFVFTIKLKVLPSIHSVNRKTYGEIFLPLGVVVCALTFLPEKVINFQYGILIMGISDALASLWGERYGRHIFMVMGHKKSIEGSLMFFISSVIVSSVFLHRIDLGIVMVSFILALSGLIS